jgi:hypothetical protein
VSRRFALAAAATLGVLVPLLALPTTAAADDETGSALISLDGSAFSRAPNGSIFPDGVVLVPGATTTGTFYVKNDSGRAADLRISVAGASSASATLIDALTLEAATPETPNGTPVPLSSDGNCIPLLSGELLHSQASTAVRITLALDELAGNPDQGMDADAQLVVALTDPGVPSADYDCTDGGGIPLTPAPAPAAQHPVDTPVSETTDPVPALNARQPTAAATDHADTPQTGVATPAAETPPTAGALPLSPADSPIPLPWLGIAGLLLGVGAFVATKLRGRHSR